MFNLDFHNLLNADGFVLSVGGDVCLCLLFVVFLYPFMNKIKSE